LLSRKTTGQGAITWRFYKDISKFLGCLPVNDSSLVDETIGGDGATVEMIIDSMQNGTTALSGDEEFETDATAGRTPPAPAHDVLFESAALPSSSSSQTADTEDRQQQGPTSGSKSPSRKAKPACHPKESAGGASKHEPAVVLRHQRKPERRNGATQNGAGYSP
ncbi:hypothetical protein V5799_008253, partial [Amblyomma americanum]